jgi:hypothetical protein
VDQDLTIAGPNSHLAGLTVRMSDMPPLTDFGPKPANYQPPYGPGEPPVVAVLPTPVPWSQGPTQDPNPTTTIARPKVRRKGPRRIALAVAAVLAGAAIGVFVVPKLLDQRGAQTSTPTKQTTPRTTTTAPTTTTPPPTAAPPATGGDPAFAPTLAPLDDKGDSIVLTWSDPTSGNAQFVVVDVTNTDREALATVADGTTTYTVEGLDPAADQYCFQVIGIGLDDPTTDRGASESVCTKR